MKFTTHVMTRAQQRSTTQKDIEFLVANATQVTDGYFLSNKDVDAIVRSHKREIRRCERLRGRFVVVDGETVISIYPANRRKQKRLLRYR